MKKSRFSICLSACSDLTYVKCSEVGCLTWLNSSLLLHPDWWHCFCEDPHTHFMNLKSEQLMWVNTLCSQLTIGSPKRSKFKATSLHHMQAYTDCMYSPIMKAEVPCTAKNCLSGTQWLVIQVWIWVLWFLLVLLSTWFVYVCASCSILLCSSICWDALEMTKIKESSSAFVNVGNRSAVCKYFVLLVASSLNFEEESSCHSWWMPQPSCSLTLQRLEETKWDWLHVKQLDCGGEQIWAGQLVRMHAG